MGGFVICEKRSQADAVRRAVGSRYGPVLPARGHIIRLVEPQEYREDWKTWSNDMLWPGQFYPKKPAQKTRSLLDRMAEVARTADTVIVATDADREGLVIGWEILDYLKFQGTALRVEIMAEDEVSIRQAFDNRTPLHQHRPLYDSGQAREQADQVVNLTLTRTATVNLKDPGRSGAIGIGRCKTPVLSIIAERALEIENFVAKPLYAVVADVTSRNGDVKLICDRVPGGDVETGEPEDASDELNRGEEALAAVEDHDGRILDKSVAEALTQAATGHRGPLQVTRKKGKQKPPKLFDLTALQAAGSSIFGWDGEKTLDVAQSLYSNAQIITYPRAEATHLPEAAINDVPKMIESLTGLKPYIGFAQLFQPPQIRKGKAGHFSDKALEGCSHFAIIPNVNTRADWRARLAKCTPEERLLFDVICRRYLAALAPDFVFESTKISLTVPHNGQDWTFTANGKTPVSLGWRAILKASDPKDGGQDLLPPLQDGEEGFVREAILRESMTKPPSRFTDGALLRAMKEAWRFVPEEEIQLRQQLKDVQGIGTPATRGQIIEGLLEQQQIVRKGKFLEPTQAGMDLYLALRNVAPNITSPVRTARYEFLWEMVRQGEINALGAVEKIVKATRKEVAGISGLSMRLNIGKVRKPSPAMVKAAESIARSKGLKLPSGLKTDSAVCKSFLDEHGSGSRRTGEDGQGPSEAALAFAQKIQATLSVPLPDDVKADYRQLASWIDAHKDKMPVKTPSEKQLALAERLAEEKGVPLPEKARSDWRQCSAFIDAQMKGSRKKTPKRRKAS